ncbi:Kazal domain [Trinorchestia longiramus]|nr:Kazal domain [Trinorchestia longiramus]
MFVSLNLEALAEDCRLLDDCDRRGYSSSEGPQVCGTNGNTFLNICHLRIVVCQTGNVKLKHEGPCTATEKCPDKRRAALQDRAAGEQGVYVPECLPNGFFEPMQCHTDTGFCWCVLPDGTLIGESANGARIKDLNCTASAQTAVQRRRPQVEQNEASSSRQCLLNSNLGRCNKKGESCSYLSPNSGCVW